MTDKTKLNPTYCPYCDYLIENATAPENPTQTVAPGRRVICIECLNLSILNESMQLRRPTLSEFAHAQITMGPTIEEMRTRIREAKERAGPRPETRGMRN